MKGPRIRADRRSVKAQHGLTVRDALIEEWYNSRVVLEAEGIEGASRLLPLRLEGVGLSSSCRDETVEQPVGLGCRLRVEHVAERSALERVPDHALSLQQVLLDSDVAIDGCLHRHQEHQGSADIGKLYRWLRQIGLDGR